VHRPRLSCNSAFPTLCAAIRIQRRCSFASHADGGADAAVHIRCGAAAAHMLVLRRRIEQGSHEEAGRHRCVRQRSMHHAIIRVVEAGRGSIGAATCEATASLDDASAS